MAHLYSSTSDASSLDSLLQLKLILCEKCEENNVALSFFFSSLCLDLAGQQFNVAEHSVRGLMMQRNVSKEINSEEMMTKGDKKTRRERESKTIKLTDWQAWKKEIAAYIWLWLR